MSQTVIPVILSGGSGTRLWPLSRPERPKQLLRLVTERTLLQDTLMRTRGLGARAGSPLVICNESHRFLVAEQLREIDAEPKAIVLEPAGRNTAPAAAVAAELALSGADADDDPILLVLPADHVILDEPGFIAAVEQGLTAATAGKLVTFGVLPDKPETGYGYIRRGPTHGGWAEVAEFVEKPDRPTAESYLSSGDYFWNSGMFLFSARAYLDALSEHAPEMVPACRDAITAATVETDFLRLGPRFLECPADSIDYAVMEKTPNAAVVALEAGWSDVGSWAALLDVLEKDPDGNVVRGDVVSEGCRNCYIAATSRPVAVIGLRGCVVVETEDGVLVMPRDRAQAVKGVVEQLASRQ